ncbi:hypothetical protein H4R35_005025 [Dimargaris xerosporica]|nr:hypothetical protein H4R35_005025 [Dimargaris xerosporica]
MATSGRIYDVTSGADHYGPGGPYHFFAGRDAARAWGTNCLNYPPHYTYDLRGLTDQQLSAIEGWQEFYDNHHTYFYAGKLIHRPIEPDSPLPPDCQNAVPKPGQ